MRPVVLTLLLALLFASPLCATGCAIVPQNRRAALADPIMRLGDEPTEAYRKQKFYGVREGAAGGDGASAGGGCGCQ
ncbi:MAG TPA: DUF4266 domain-containing protein [Polyangia bacterium]|jgi:hypothetical protein|nr:DUF4266 domain-containing protein [Polyangia bacterium]